MRLEDGANHFHRHAAFGEIAERLAVLVDGAHQIARGRHMIVHGLHGGEVGLRFAGAGGGEGGPRAGFARGAEGVAGHPVGEGLAVGADGDDALAADEVQAEAVVLGAVIGDGIKISNRASFHLISGME